MNHRLNIDTRKKLNDLLEKFKQLIPGGVLITFSGGVDSALLVWAAKQVMNGHNNKVLALTTYSASLPEQDKKDVVDFINKTGIKHVWQESHELTNEAYLRNDALRCYHCKTELFDIAQKVAEEKGYSWIIYGYNASDKTDFRPGHQAAQEKNVLSPLADVGLTKEEIREILLDAGLEIGNKVASPCLSSRISHGIPVTIGKLNDVAFMEDMIKKAGVILFRVRINEAKDGMFLRIETHPGEMDKILEIREQLDKAGRIRGYKWITLDLGGYRTGGGTE